MRRTAVLLSSAAVALAMVACNEGGGRADQILAEVRDGLREAGTARFRFEVKVAVTTIGGEGTADYSASLVDLQLSFPPELADETVRLVLGDEVSYLLVPEDRRDRTRGRAWARFPNSPEGRAQFDPLGPLRRTFRRCVA